MNIFRSSKIILLFNFSDLGELLWLALVMESRCIHHILSTIFLFLDSTLSAITNTLSMPTAANVHLLLLLCKGL
jgi:hypothetical protein